MAYLLTLAEAHSTSPVFGKVWMEQVWLAFTTPDDVRLLLDPKLRARYEYWLHEGGAAISHEQLDMFD